MGNIDTTGWLMLHPAAMEFCRRQLTDDKYRNLHIEYVKQLYENRRPGGWRLNGRYYELETKVAEDPAEELEW